MTATPKIIPFYIKGAGAFCKLLTLTFLLLFVTAAGAKELKIIGLGDSLMAGYGLAPQEAFPVQLERALKDQGHQVEIINAGVSGDTTAGGLARLDWVLTNEADAIIIQLGANDALRGTAPDETRTNLDAIITRAKAEGLTILLAGMLAPPNWGVRYGDAFNAIYPDLAAKHDIALYPFFLDGVAAEPELNQADGIHPTAEGAGLIAEKILPYVVSHLVKPGESQ